MEVDERNVWLIEEKRTNKLTKLINLTMPRKSYSETSKFTVIVKSKK